MLLNASFAILDIAIQIAVINSNSVSANSKVMGFVVSLKHDRVIFRVSTTIAAYPLTAIAVPRA